MGERWSWSTRLGRLCRDGNPAQTLGDVAPRRSSAKGAAAALRVPHPTPRPPIPPTVLMVDDDGRLMFRRRRRSQALRDLGSKMTTEAASARPSADAALLHPFFTGASMGAAEGAWMESRVPTGFGGV